MKATTKIFFVLFMLLSPHFCLAQHPDHMTPQQRDDDKRLKEYFTKNKIKATKTASGLYYVITKKGTGENAKPNQQVTINYIGKFLDGRKFDANVDDNFKPIRPFSFLLGTGTVIKGWDEGVQLLNTGCHATLYIPSELAYGIQGRGARMPPNSILVFEVELVAING